MNPLDLLKQAKAYLSKPHRDIKFEADVKRKAGIYQSLINDERYKEVMAGLFARKIGEKETAIQNISLTYTLEQIGREYIKLRAEKEILNDLFNTPETHFRNNEILKLVEELERKELIK